MRGPTAALLALSLLLGVNVQSQERDGQSYGRLVLEGNPPGTQVPIPSSDEACFLLPDGVLHLVLPPGTAARIPSPNQFCLRAEDGFTPGRAEVRTGRGSLFLDLAPGGEPATYTLVYPSPGPAGGEVPANPPTPARGAEPRPSQAEPPKAQEGTNPSPSPAWAKEPGFLLQGALQYLEEGSLRIGFILTNSGPLPAVLKSKDIRLFLGGKPLAEAALDGLTFTSGRREWLPPGAGVQGSLTLPREEVRALFPHGEILLELTPTLMDDGLTPKPLRIRWRITWYPLMEGGRP